SRELRRKPFANFSARTPDELVSVGLELEAVVTAVAPAAAERRLDCRRNRYDGLSCQSDSPVGVVTAAGVEPIEIDARADALDPPAIQLEPVREPCCVQGSVGAGHFGQ